MPKLKPKRSKPSIKPVSSTPCLHCGGHRILLAGNVTKDADRVIMKQTWTCTCDTCGDHGPPAEDEEGAIMAWEYRAPPKPDGEPEVMTDEEAAVEEAIERMEEEEAALDDEDKYMGAQRKGE